LAGGVLAEEVEMVHPTLERTVGTITLTVSATRRNCANEKIFFLYFLDVFFYLPLQRTGTFTSIS
jgi:hypothetical protein